MKTLKDIFDETFKPISLSESEDFNNFLTEEADFTPVPVISEADDPFGGDDTAGGGDAGGDAGGDLGGDAGGDPFGGDAGGADPFGGPDGGAGGGGAGGGAGGEGGAAAGEDKDKDEDEDTVDFDAHEDDPEFNQGTNNPNDVTLSDTPGAKAVFDIENIMKTVTSVIQTLSEDQLVEIEKVKACIELIFNGKLLNEEDLEFENIKNAIFLVKKISAKLDIKARAYLNRKLKEPLIKKRDKIKQDIASKKGELNNTRDLLTKLDTEV
jgi:hypothetical protein